MLISLLLETRLGKFVVFGIVIMAGSCGWTVFHELSEQKKSDDRYSAEVNAVFGDPHKEVDPDAYGRLLVLEQRHEQETLQHVANVAKEGVVLDNLALAAR